MPLTLVLGPANSARAGEVFGGFAAAAGRGAARLVVPTAADVTHYAAELAERAPLGVITTFPGLLGEIARRCRVVPRTVGTVGRAAILRHVVAGAALDALAGSASAPGFPAALGDLIAELGRELVTPQRFAAALSAWAAADPRRASFAAELGGLVLAYARELEQRGLTDPELGARAVLDALRRDPSRWGAETVLLYGFDDLTGTQRDAVEVLSRACEVVVSLPYEPGREALAARAEVVESLRPLADAVRELPAAEAHYAPASRAALHALERGLFEGGGAAVDPGDAVRVLEAGGLRAECELIAAEIAALEGVAHDDVVVVARSPEVVRRALGQALAAVGLPLAGGGSMPFVAGTLGRAVRAMARCAWAADADAWDLLRVLRAPGMLERTDLADRIEAALLQGGLRSLAAARRLSDAAGWSFDELDRLAAATDPPGALLRAAERLFARPLRGRAPVLDAGQTRDAAALRALGAAVDELALTQLTLSGGELLDVLDRLEVPSVDAEGIALAGPLEVRARRFSHVFVCDLQEGSFPAAGAAEPFLNDELRWELAAASGLRLRPREDPLERERHLFYACVSRATERVTLSYRSSDEEGNLALPSPFLADVAALFTPELMACRRRRLLADVVWDPAEAPNPRERALALAAAAGEAEAPVGDPSPRGLGPAALARSRHSRMLSAGALESYARCPVGWLVDSQLAPDELEPTPVAMARGQVLHGLLEQVFAGLGEALTPQTLDRALGLLDGAVATAEMVSGPEEPPGVVEAERSAVAAALRRYLITEAHAGAGWAPARLELRFGMEPREGELPGPGPLVLGEGAEQVLVRGVIDRVDVCGGQAIVRDYKSGSARPERAGANWLREDQLQVALYMLAARRLLGLEPVGGFYQPLGGAKLSPRGVFRADVVPSEGLVRTDARDAEGIEELLAAAEARALELAAQLRSGALVPCPSTCSRGGCRHPAICRSV